MEDTQMLVKLTTGEEFRVPLSKFNILSDGRITLNTDEGQYSIFPIAIAYTLKEKYVATKKNDKETAKASSKD